MNQPKSQSEKGGAGQKPPTPENAVRQRHQLGEPVRQDSVQVPKAP